MEQLQDLLEKELTENLLAIVVSKPSKKTKENEDKNISGDYFSDKKDSDKLM